MTTRMSIIITVLLTVRDFQKYVLSKNSCIRTVQCAQLSERDDELRPKRCVSLSWMECSVANEFG